QLPLISRCGSSVSGRCRPSLRLIAPASLTVIGTLRDFRPLAPASQRTRSSTLPRTMESSIKPDMPPVPLAPGHRAPTRECLSRAGCGRPAPLGEASDYRRPGSRALVECGRPLAPSRAPWVASTPECAAPRITLGAGPAEEGQQGTMGIEDGPGLER